MFFTIHLRIVTSNQIPMYRKLNLSLTSSIYFVFLHLEMQKTLKKTKAHHACSYFLWKETNHKFLKVAAAEILFSGAYVIGTTCFDDILCGNWKDITFHEKLMLLWDLFCAQSCWFLRNQCLKEFRILCVISTITIWY